MQQHSIDTAQRLWHQLRAAEDRIAELEAEVEAYREQAERAEQWLHKRAVEKGSILGRPKIGADPERRIQAQLRAGKGILATAKTLGVGTGTVHRIARAMRPFESAAAA